MEVDDSIDGPVSHGADQQTWNKVWATIPSLSNMCSASIVYRLWTRRDIYENCNDPKHWQLLENKVSADVKNLPLPELVKYSLLLTVKPSGRHFFDFLHVLFRKFQTSERWLTTGMLYRCLTLYPVGLINQRKTAEKILRSEILNPVVAFRLASINFLEEEVLKSWPLARHLLLHKIVLERQQVKLDSQLSSLPVPDGYSNEPYEVLFWISFCLSREIGNDINEMPVLHHLRHLNWDESMTAWASVSCDVQFYECIEEPDSRMNAYFSYEEEIRKFCTTSSNSFLASFYYHFSSSLSSVAKEDFFREYPVRLMTYFLQWPLSSLFIEDPERIWNLLIHEELQEWLLIIILEILSAGIYLYRPYGFNVPQKFFIERQYLYRFDHLDGLFCTLWKLSPFRMRAHIVTFLIFTDLVNSFLEKASGINTDMSTLKEELWPLFLSNGGAVIEFLREPIVNLSFDNVVSKYMPQKNFNFLSCEFTPFSMSPIFKFDALQNLLIRRREFYPFRARPAYLPHILFVMRDYAENKIQTDNLHTPSGFSKMRLFDFPEIKNKVDQLFVSYIHDCLSEENDLETSLFCK